MASDIVKSHEGTSHQSDGSFAVQRSLPEEKPVAMVYDGTTLAVMMASPDDLLDLAYGFALSEGIITRLDQLSHHEVVAHDVGVEVRFWLSEDRGTMLKDRRRALAGPVGCGLCGIESLEQAIRPLPRIASKTRFSHADVAGATDALRQFQRLHRLTSATHGAGFLHPDGGIVMAREDVGRHNALDKLIGALARAEIDPAEGAFVMTSRLSVELVQKCATAGAPMLIAVSAPTAQAVQLASDAGITLVAFARGGGFDIYAHPERIERKDPDVP